MWGYPILGDLSRHMMGAGGVWLKTASSLQVARSFLLCVPWYCRDLGMAACPVLFYSCFVCAFFRKGPQETLCKIPNQALCTAFAGHQQRFQDRQRSQQQPPPQESMLIAYGG